MNGQDGYKPCSTPSSPCKPHLLPGSAVVEREDGGEGQLSQSEKTHPSYLIPHLLGSLEKGMVLLRLTVDSKV